MGELSNVRSHIVLKCLFLARIGRPDVLWSVSKLAREVTTWTRACGKRLARLSSYIHHPRNFSQHCHVGSTAKSADLVYFKILISQMILKIQTRPRGARCVFSGVALSYP